MVFDSWWGCLRFEEIEQLPMSCMSIASTRVGNLAEVIEHVFNFWVTVLQLFDLVNF